VQEDLPAPLHLAPEYYETEIGDSLERQAKISQVAEW